MNIHKKNINISKQMAFSLVEIIITISIITLLTIVWLSTKQWYDENNINAKIISDIQSINNALELSLQENNSLPMPEWNTNFYKVDTSYAHSYDDTETFWVYGSITENTISKKYLNNIPLDPKTKSYYSYWKTKDKNQFEIAAVQIVDYNPVTKVVWNYSAENWPYNLIREYNWPNFVSNNSKTNLPYNPFELKLVWKINNINWNIEINQTKWNIITNNDEILKYNLEIWDKINVSTWSTAQLYFSDWSTSVIWDKNENTNIEITDLMLNEKIIYPLLWNYMCQLVQYGQKQLI